MKTKKHIILLVSLMLATMMPISSPADELNTDQMMINQKPKIIMELPLFDKDTLKLDVYQQAGAGQVLSKDLTFVNHSAIPVEITLTSYTAKVTSGPDVEVTTLEDVESNTERNLFLWINEAEKDEQGNMVDTDPEQDGIQYSYPSYDETRFAARKIGIIYGLNEQEPSAIDISGTAVSFTTLESGSVASEQEEEENENEAVIIEETPQLLDSDTVESEQEEDEDAVIEATPAPSESDIVSSKDEENEDVVIEMTPEPLDSDTAGPEQEENENVTIEIPAEKPSTKNQITLKFDGAMNTNAEWNDSDVITIIPTFTITPVIVDDELEVPLNLTLPIELPEAPKMDLDTPDETDIAAGEDIDIPDEIDITDEEGIDAPDETDIADDGDEPPDGTATTDDGNTDTPNATDTADDEAIDETDTTDEGGLL